MTSVLTDPTGVCNYGLAKIGFRGRIGSLFDGTLAAKKCLDVYGEERDSLLSTGEWDFAERTAVGILLKQAPGTLNPYVTTPWTTAYPALPWLYEYAYPADALEIRTVKKPPFTIPNFDPRYNRFSVDNDTGPQTVPGYTPPVKIILTNVAGAVIVYTGQITDPTDWTPSFTEALASRLGKALAPVLMGLDHAKLAAAEEAHDTAQAAETRG